MQNNHPNKKYMNFGYVKVAAAIPSVKVADCGFNTQQTIKLLDEAEKESVEIVIFPELGITGYTCGDLFAQDILLKNARLGLKEITYWSKNKNIIAIIGLPLLINNVLYNTAAIVNNGKIIGIVPKTYLPNYKEFYEMRWFANGNKINEFFSLFPDFPECKVCSKQIFLTPYYTFGVEICEDVWATIPPSSFLALNGAEILFNMSADNECISKHNYVKSLICQQSARCLSGYIFSSCGFGESTTDIVFTGNGMIYENGTLLEEGERFSFKHQLVISEIDVELLRMERRVNTTFSTSSHQYKNENMVISYIKQQNNGQTKLTRKVSALPFVPSGNKLDERCEEIFSIQTSGLAKRIMHTHSKTVVIGISGGLDSTLALLVCVKTFDKLGMDRKGIIGVTMPGFGTTDRTYHNAIQLMHALGINFREIDIKKSCIQHFKDIKQDINRHDVTYENGQARERTQILMDLANQLNGMVIGTGDLSELALGWATYNGDHMSMYGVNSSIPKTLVKHLVNWIAINEVDEKSKSTLLDIIDTPISPELIPADENGNICQKTEDLVGPYELHDFFLYNFMRNGFPPAKIFYLANMVFEKKYSKEIIKKWLCIFIKRFFSQQFKRSCLPDGPKIGSVSISPRGDWRMPSDTCADIWLKEAENL